MRLVLVGSGHVFELGEAIRGLVHAERPQFVAVELDERRFQGLAERRAGREPSKEQLKRTPRLYRYLARYQEKVAESFGAEPGMEMVAAADAAREIGARIVCIDRDAEAVVREAVARMPWRERLRFLWTAARALLIRDKQPTFQAEIDRYQSDPQAYLEELGRDFPTIKKVLIDERNEHMAAALRELVRNGNVVAIVGDGHVPGLLALLADLGPVVHRLKDLQSYKGSARLQWKMTDGGARVGFSFTGQSLENSVQRA